MDRVQADLARACYAQFAIEQAVSLDVIADSAVDQSLALATSQTPSWFSAAADPESMLTELAPELQVIPLEPEESGEKVADLDLVRMYAPELQPPVQETVAMPRPSAKDEDDDEQSSQREANPQIGLLRELSGLDD